MTKEFLPKISKKDLEIKDSWDFLYAILGVYFDWMEKEWEEFVFENLSDEQATLYIYRNLDAQVTNGGFVQMIYNGYENWVFNEVFIQKLNDFGLEKTAKIVEKAKKIFEKYREKFANVNREDWDAFANLYKECPEFEDCDSEYYEINDAEVDILAEYVRENISDFIEVTE